MVPVTKPEKRYKGLNDLLRLEAIQSFEKSKTAREEAGTKPMFLMLAEVLVIVVVPAFLPYKRHCKNIKIYHRRYDGIEKGVKRED